MRDIWVVMLLYHIAVKLTLNAIDCDNTDAIQNAIITRYPMTVLILWTLAKCAWGMAGP